CVRVSLGRGTSIRLILLLCLQEPCRLPTCSVLRRNVIKRLRPHEVLAATWLDNLFLDAQIVEQDQSFKQGPSVLIFQIGDSSALWNNKAQECIKLQFPFDGKPALKHWDDLAGSNRLKW